jgi:hypothetical protein
MEDAFGRLRGGSWTPAEVTETTGVVHSGGYVEASPGGNAPGSSSDADCIYRDRFIRPVSQAIFASRQGAYTDWAMSSDVSDVGRPFAMQLSEAGELGGSIVALIPHKDAYLLAATSDSLWVVQGDPTADGRLQNISRDVGMVGPRAWCRDHLDRYYFLSSHGLYTVSSSGDGLQAVSEDVIPVELTGVEDTDEARVVLEYDHETRGVYIHIPDTVSWLYDTERQGFWPFKTDYAGSHIAIGPLLLGDGNTYGRLVQLHGIIASGSTNVIWRVLVADTAEQVCANAKDAMNVIIQVEQGEIEIQEPENVQSMGVWTAGVNHRSYPRARGKYMVLLLSTLNGDWGFEGAACFIEPSGKWR